MAEDKKPRIDLKARLGKAQAAAQVPIVPGSRPSAGAGSVPPPPGIGGAPNVPATDPFGMPVAPVPRASVPPAAATIKIEMDDEVVRAHTKTGKRMAMVSGVTLVCGGLLGFMWGGRSEQGRQTQIAITGAKGIAEDVEKSQAKIKELSDKIGVAIGSLKEKKFPETFSSELSGLAIPFGAEKLEGRGIGKFNARCQKLLFSYTQDVEALNDRKDALRNLFAGQKKAINDLLGASGNPKIGWVVFAQKSPAHGALAVLAPIAPKDVFSYKDEKWPGKFQIMAGGQAVDTSRYEKGDVFSSDTKVVTFPLEPESVASAFPNDVLSRVQSELTKTDEVLRGRPEMPGVQDESPGVIKNGEALLVELRKIINAK